MYLITLKKDFLKQLAGLYTEQEIHSFFSILTKHYLGLSRIDVALHPKRVLLEDDQLRFQKVIQRLQNQEPIQYIIGQTEFFGLPIKVNSNTLIPRPETEELVDWVISEFKNTTMPLRILDIGTGSGCIAVALAKNLKNHAVSALDVSKEALEVSKENARLNQVQVRFFQQDLFRSNTLPETFHVIVSNPPYVRDSEKKLMSKNVLQFEPETALFVKDDNPLVFYERIALLARTHLAINGKLYFEINEYLAEDMKRMLEEKGFYKIKLRKDFRGVPRMICSQFKG